MARTRPRGTSNTNDRGSSYDRARRKQWLLDQFGDGKSAECYRFEICGTVVDYVSITVDRIVPGCDGGRYVRGNIRPACSPCNTETGARLGNARMRAGKLRM